MITDSELKISKESYTRKDFYQIYPEILELVNKITDRWMPSAESNESDPGVVLLKLLGFIADKTNYNIDKNVLECFMPSATQEDSMRKLCDMMGYEMHYYRSGEVNVSFMWTGTQLAPTSQESTGSIRLEAFETVVTDDSSEVSYVLTEPVVLTHRNEVKSANAIEGTYCDFEINDDNVVRYYNLDDNLRLYFSENHVAENGVWVYNTEDDEYKKNPWTKVNNLNTQLPDSKVWKFGYDSRKKLPYIQFSKDVIELINNGLSIHYIRTTGVSGNVAAKNLTTLANTTTVNLYTNSTGNTEAINISEDNNNYLTIQNVSASINGADAESINEAYNGFKKTVGTFDTLVTCRDYANAIYNMLDTNSNPLVSNVIVSDIRDNLNFKKEVMTLDQYGCHSVVISEKDDGGNDKINHFDLYILPFKPITTSYTSKTFTNSFKPTTENYYEIINELDNYKTISHDFKTLDTITNATDIYCIKNKYQLAASITTTYKVNSAEQKQILNNVYEALYKNFNARQVDFGEEIPYDTVLSVIENADTRIKVVILDDFVIKPYVMLADGSEYYLSPTNADSNGVGKEKYREFIARNVLAGKLPLFNYDNEIEYKYGEQASDKYKDIIGGKQSYPVEKDTEPVATNSITYVDTALEIKTEAFNKEKGGYTLDKNEVIQFIAPAYEATVTYPAYTNYFMRLTNSESGKAVACSLGLNPINDIVDTETFGAAYKALQEEGGHPGAFIYKRATNPNYSLTPGYLVDESYYKYSAVTSYSTNGKYYALYKITKSADGTWTVGKDAIAGEGTNAVLGYIKKNTEYQLQSGDFLAIHFKDSAEVNHDIIYDKSSKQEWINEVEQKKENFSGYIKCNFDLYDSKTYHSSGTGHKYVKTTGYTFGNKTSEIPGMFSLDSSEEIEPREEIKVTFDGNSGSVLKCYWYTNEPKSSLTFKKEGDEFVRILDSDEYFFYTNAAETALVTYGSGTVLKLEGNWGTSGENNKVVWTLPTNTTSSLNVDDVASDGIAAFGDVDWQIKSINDQKTLTICETTIVTLGEGDTLYGLKLKLNSTTTNSTWQEIKQDENNTVVYNTTNKLTSGLTWKVRSILNLNVGPYCIQTLANKFYSEGEFKSTTATTPEESVLVKEYIQTYSSKWKDSENNYVDPVKEANWSALTEAATKYEKGKFENISLKANYLVQRSGGEKISMHRYTTDETEVDDLKFIPFINSNCIMKLKSSESGNLESVVDINEKYSKINLNTLETLTIPVNIKSGKFGLVAFYYSAGATDGDVKIEVTGSSANISLYSEMSWINNTENNNSYTLKEGLNCLRLDNVETLEIVPEKDENHEGTLLLTQLSVINSKETASGVNYELLGLDKDVSETPSENDDCNKFLKDYIIKVPEFFYNVSINNDDRIDVDNMNPDGNNYLGWQSVNNVCNKFTIAELDVNSFDKIQIARPSKK